MSDNQEDDVYVRILSGAELTVEEEKELHSIIHSPLVLKGLRRVLEEAKAKDSLRAADLSSEEGLKQTLGKHGAVRGMNRAVEILLEIGTTEGADNAVESDQTKS